MRGAAEVDSSSLAASGRIKWISIACAELPFGGAEALRGGENRTLDARVLRIRSRLVAIVATLRTTLAGTEQDKHRPFQRPWPQIQACCVLSASCPDTASDNVVPSLLHSPVRTKDRDGQGGWLWLALTLRVQRILPRRHRTGAYEQGEMPAGHHPTTNDASE